MLHLTSRISVRVRIRLDEQAEGRSHASKTDWQVMLTCVESDGARIPIMSSSSLISGETPANAQCGSWVAQDRLISHEIGWCQKTARYSGQRQQGRIEGEDRLCATVGQWLRRRFLLVTK
jgi:hypothetical protein